MNTYLKVAVNIYILMTLLLISNVAMAKNPTEFHLQIENILSEEQLTGVVWATVSGNNVRVGSAGLSKVVESSSMNESQKVHVGSVTKTVLAIGVMRLISQGKLSLESNVEAQLPQLAFNNPWYKTNPVTVKNLLDHTAGLDNIRMWQFLSTRPTPDTPLRKAFGPANNKLLEIRTKPGAQYSYSNMGYTLLAMVIESVTGVRYEHFLDENLLKPLGMTDSTFKFVSQAGNYADDKLAMGYFENNVSQAALPIYLRPAGQYTTTAPDMAKFMKFLLGSGALDGESFISDELMTMMSYPQGTDAKNVGLQIGHGLALAARDRHNVLGMCHPGTTIGFRAYICLFPEENKAFFYAINTDSETANYEQFNSLFIQALSIRKSEVELPRTEAMDISKLVGVYLPSPNNMAEFEWLDLMFNFKWLTQEQGHLIMSSLQSDDRTLIPISASLLRASDRTKASHGVITDEDQNVFISDGLSTFKKQSVLKIVAYWVSLILGVLGLLYIVLIGFSRLVTRSTKASNYLYWPFFNIISFSIPVYLYYNQSIFRFGELTSASLLLAIASGLLPVTILVTIFFGVRTLKTQAIKRDVLASLMLFQLCLVLLYWDVIPLVFWK